MKTIVQSLARSYFSHFPLERGKWRLWLKLLPLLKSDDSFEVERLLKYGIRMSLNPHEVIDRFIYYWGCWEPNETWAIRQILRPGDSFIDVGAHIGYFTLLASRLITASGTVIAFEPVPRTLQRLKKNLHLNRTTNVTIHECAISDRPGTIRINEIAQGNAGTNTMRRSDARFESWEVPSVRLDHIVPMAPIRLLKIDVEGAELLVLKSFLEHINAGLVSFILCEVTESFLLEMGNSKAELLSLLSSVGYRAYNCDNLRFTPLTPDHADHQDQMNILFCRGPIAALARHDNGRGSATGRFSPVSTCSYTTL